MTPSPRHLWLPALLLGSAITLGLFWLMALMVQGGQLELQKTEARRLVDFIRLKQAPKPPPPTRRPPPKPPEKEPPPPQPQLATPRPVANVTPDIDIPALDVPLSSRLQGSLLAGIDVAKAGPKASGQVIPLVRIKPRYPMRARMRRIEGWVKLEFTITPEGTVTDVKVVESHPKGVFERAAIKAISLWKFKPLIADGRPTAQRAVQVLEFKLQK
ncbi:periplasmic protein TonB [Methylomarinovum caldicuralii]|uniref:Protein TonB n=1 Tax=Methylomarinovum caldicuralii TaxID=438856 RepID=A0AAU9C5V9_9GAMM|nr:energy transducer TonB [Methylomarinovum caldicuralii]BCX82524.1 periplasmic protein TonB [Methylomarinovum caldicuralii]